MNDKSDWLSLIKIKANLMVKQIKVIKIKQGKLVIKKQLKAIQIKQ